MEEILNGLEARGRVLDLGSGTGSFDPQAYAFRTIRLDAAAHPGLSPLVRGDAEAMPFARGAFHAVIANHCFEHFRDVDAALTEVGRVLRPDGALYVSVPDAGTFCDRLYRWLNPGDHIQRFTSAGQLAARVEKATGLRHRATRELFTSFSFLNARNRRGRAPGKLLLLANGNEAALALLARLVDRRYGWAMWFGNTGDVDESPRLNVCVRCGCGFAEPDLPHEGRSYACARCGARNHRFTR